MNDTPAAYPPPPLETPLSWPLGGVDGEGRLVFARDDQSVRESILCLLLTRPGERLMRPELGAGLTEFVHQPNNATTRGLIANRARKAVARWEPRVDLDGVDVLPVPGEPAQVQVEIRYRLRGTAIPRVLGLTLSLGSAP